MHLWVGLQPDKASAQPKPLHFHQGRSRHECRPTLTGHVVIRKLELDAEKLTTMVYFTAI
jgi:hypothetical protein